MFEAKYASLFPSGTGNVAKPLRMALGSLIIQNRYQFSDNRLRARKDYLTFAKSRKHSKNQVRATMRILFLLNWLYRRYVMLTIPCGLKTA